MKTGFLLGLLSFLATFSAVGSTSFSSVIRGEIPYWEIGTVSSDPVWFQVSRTSALEYRAWLKDDPEKRVDNGEFLYRFGLDWESVDLELPVDDWKPRQIEAASEGERFASVVFLARKKPEKNRVIYSLERSDDGQIWFPVESIEFLSREELGAGLERRVLSDSVRLDPMEKRNLRLRIRLEPAPKIFAHYMSSLNPGSGALGFLMQPIPAYLRLFHDRPEMIEPLPRGLPEFYRSTGGTQRDQPLIRPGFVFSSAVESAELEIERAIRAGLDGFAINCLEGRTDFVEALFVAASNRKKDHPEEPSFLLTLSLDINVVPFGEREMLVSVADLISRFFALGDDSVFSQHLARRGGKLMVMGYQSHWIWIDYLYRLLELWEIENRGFQWGDERIAWPEALGPVPAVPHLPEEVVRIYETNLQRKLRQLEGDRSLSGRSAFQVEAAYFLEAGFSEKDARLRALESLARKSARKEAVESWARTEDGWRQIREAYGLLEAIVGREIFWQYEAADLDSVAGSFEKVVERVACDFPAVNFFLPKGDFAERARSVVRARGAEWGEPIYSQYVAYGQNEQDGLFFGTAHGGDGTGTFREGWYRAIGENLERRELLEADVLDGGRSSLIQYTTWNDYGEHTHLAPSLQMRFALSELGRHLIHTWKTGEKIGTLGEQVFLFYRKHPSEAEPFPFHPGTAMLPVFFEVVSILNEPGSELKILRENRGKSDFVQRAESRFLESGLQAEVFSEPDDHRLWQEGKVAVQVLKESGEIFTVEGWEEFTHRPFREDSTLVGASSLCEKLLAEEAERWFGEFRFSEYGDLDRDGLPNWFEMFYFGRGWLNLEDQTGANIAGDENRDGISNLEHYRNGTHPVYFSDPHPYSEDPFRIGKGPVRLEAERFDWGGPGVSYRLRTYESMRGGNFRDLRSDLPTHSQVEENESDRGDWIVGPFVEGEWLSYTVEISTGCYEVRARVREGGGLLKFDLDGEEVLEAAIEHRGLWSTQILGKIQIKENRSGRRNLRLRFGDSGYRLNWIEFRPCN